MPAANVTPVKSGVHPLSPRIWIPFFNGMTDTVRHLDSGPGSSPGQALRRNDERKSRLLVNEYRTPPLGTEGAFSGSVTNALDRSNRERTRR